ALATGVATAVSVPLDRAGVGWLVAAVVAAGAVAVVAGTTGRTGGRAGLARLGWLLATVCLVGAGTIRAADWLTVLCLLTAAGTAALAITEGRDVRGMVLGVLAVPAAAFRAPRWGARGLSRLRGDRGGTAARGAAAVAVTAVLLIVFGALFASADAAFARLTGAVTPDLEVASAVRWVFLFAVGSVALLAAAYLLVAPPDLGGLKRAATARLSRWEWALPVAALDGLFAVFVAVQFTVLFGGAEHVLGSDGPSFAQYARGGFWQLLVVTLLTLAVLAAVGRWAPRATRRDRVLLRALLGALAGMALVVVASALYRMHIYEEAYGFTRLRVLVSACEVWLGAVFVLVLAAGVRLRAGWLPRAVVGTAVAALLGLVALNPDRFIAERNIERYVHTQRLDVWYLGTLSADAAPALVELSPALRACTLEHLPAELALTDGDWRYWNLARSRARALLAEKPVGSPEPLDCMTR
ncbi:MAG TPA: DUF4173 domain-containing protein, partial [Pilimelia sp.]|nr:DUF4173 domain-containing protein [Pilimelia sp.]